MVWNLKMDEKKQKTELPSEETLKHLGWFEIAKVLKARTQSQSAARLFDVQSFATAPKEIERELKGVEEARTILRTSGAPSFSVGELDPLFMRAEKGGTLTPEELLEIRGFAETSTRACFFFQETEELFSVLPKEAEPLTALDILADDIGYIIAPDGTIRDSASPELASLRRKQSELSLAIKRELDEILGSQAVSANLQDAYYTVRNDRYVIPVKSGSQRNVPGIVHDYSASGRTVFIEPRAILDSGNDLILVTTAAREEERRLLAELSEKVSASLSVLRKNLKTLARLDTFFARARLADEFELYTPLLGEGIALYRLRNPLMVLTREEVVKNDVELLPPSRALIITGPNAGGKSVTLKSVGLSVLMLRAGVPIAASPDSRLYPFAKIFTAFGDAQNISERLSTFSGHIKQMIEILSGADSDSLILLDEIGTDTDPREGASLAISILEQLNERGATILATTHYPELRALALSDDRFVNASVGFDPETYSPTYSLHKGLASQSFALAIAEKFGLGQHIIERAKELVGEREWRLSELARVLSEQKEKIDKELLVIAAERERLKQELKQTADKSRELDEREQALSRERHFELVKELDETRRKVAEIIKELQSGGLTMKTAVEKSIEIKEISQQEKAIQENFAKEHHVKAVKEGRALRAEELRVGLDVAIPAFHARGVVLAIDRVAGKVVVDVNGMKVEVWNYELRMPSGAKEREPKRMKVNKLQVEDVIPAKIDGGAAAEIELDIRGEMVDEALALVEEFLDRAFRGNLPFVRIIHGHGTGALKRAVRISLSKSRYVQDFKPGKQEHGGDGVTEVLLKSSL